MKRITFNVADAIPVVSRATGVISGKNSMPILNNLVITTYNDGECAVVKASDGDVWIVQKLVLADCGDEKYFSFAVGANDFFSAMRTLSGNVLTVELEETSHTVICSYESGVFKLPYENAEDFPSPLGVKDDVVSLTMSASSLVTAIEKTAFAASTIELFKSLNGVRFNVIENGIDVEAADMAMMSVYADFTVKTDGTKGGFTLPNKAVRIISKTLPDIQDNIRVTYNNSVAIIEHSTFKIVSRLQEGKFPDCRRNIRANSPINLTICRKDFQTALKRVTPMSDVASQVVIFRFSEGVLSVSAEDVVNAKAASADVKCDFSGETFVIGFKGSRMMEVLQYIDCENVRIGLLAQDKPAVITAETQQEGYEHTILVMPVQISAVNQNI